MRVKAGLILLVLLAACSSATRPQAQRPSPQETDTGGGLTIGSCVERYSSETLAARSWAFDGTVSSVQKASTETGADSIAFKVNRWYKGGDNQSTVTKQTYGVGGITSAGSISGTLGERMLVTGENESLWTCGFTQPYSSEAAAEWEAAFGSVN